jgi:histidyl-tRNA synthetase
VPVIERPRGTRDYSITEMEKRIFVENTLRKTFRSFGYQEIQTPTFEHLELFTMKSGDSIIDELYSFIDKGGRNLALRPELTAPVIRMYVDQLQMTSKPLKLFYFGNCFRYDRPQKGRYREFMQAGCELIGTNTPEALAELIALAYHLLRNVNIDIISLEIGNLSLLRLIFKEMKMTEDQQRLLLPLIDKELYSDISDLLDEIGLEKAKSTKFLNLIQHSNLDDIISYFDSSEEAINELQKMKQLIHYLINCFKVKEFKLNLGIVRGLEYYTGIVFEINALNLGAEKQLCGGGEYVLIPLFNGRETPTSGFALGFDRTILAMELEEIDFPITSIDYFVIPVTNETIDLAIKVSMILRNQGKKVDIDLMNRGIGKAMKYASSRNAKNTIIVGPDEIQNNKVSIKDMQTGIQTLISIDTLEHIKN